MFWILERESLTFDVTFYFILLLSWFCWFLGLESVCFKFFLIFSNFWRDVLCFLEIGRESLNFEIFFLENNCQFVAYFDDIQNIVVILPFEFLKKIVIFILIIKKLFVFFWYIYSQFLTYFDDTKNFVSKMLFRNEYCHYLTFWVLEKDFSIFFFILIMKKLFY